MILSALLTFRHFNYEDKGKGESLPLSKTVSNCFPFETGCQQHGNNVIPTRRGRSFTYSCVFGKRGFPMRKGPLPPLPRVYSAPQAMAHRLCVCVCERERRLLVPNQSLEHLDHFQGTESLHDLRNQRHSNCQHTSILSPLSFH